MRTIFQNFETTVFSVRREKRGKFQNPVKIVDIQVVPIFGRTVDI